MANLTVTIDDALLKRARIRALQRGTSVNAIVRAHLEAFADVDRVAEARGRLVELSASANSGSGKGGRRWTRDEIHRRG